MGDRFVLYPLRRKRHIKQIKSSLPFDFKTQLQYPFLPQRGFACCSIQYIKAQDILYGFQRIFWRCWKQGSHPNKTTKPSTGRILKGLHDIGISEEGKFKARRWTCVSIWHWQDIGKVLSRAETPLFTVAIIRGFEVKPVPEESTPSLNPLPGIICYSKEFRACIVPRKLK